jgi:hypothetical protein
VVHWYAGLKLAQDKEAREEFRLQAVAILQHAQNLGETLGKVHLSTQSIYSDVWRQATRLLVASAPSGVHSGFEKHCEMYPDLLREFTRLLLYIPGLFAKARGSTIGLNGWLANNEGTHFSVGALLCSQPSESEIEVHFTGTGEDMKLWGHPRSQVRALAEGLIVKCDDPSLWLEAVVVGSSALFAEYRRRGLDFFFHRSEHSYLGTTFAAQRRRWTACGYPYLPRVMYSLSALGMLSLLA